MSHPQEYERIQERNHEEFQLLTQNRSTQFQAMATGFSRVEVAYGERGVTIWNAVVDSSWPARRALRPALRAGHGKGCARRPVPVLFEFCA